MLRGDLNMVMNVVAMSSAIAQDPGRLDSNYTQLLMASKMPEKVIQLCINTESLLGYIGRVNKDDRKFKCQVPKEVCKQKGASASSLLTQVWDEMLARKMDSQA